MSSYSLPDLTGKNPKYLKVNMPFYAYQSGTKIFFKGSPVFASSIYVALTDGTGELLKKDGVDWAVSPDDIDVSAMSEAFIQNRDFSEKLVKSITLTSNKSFKQLLAISYQQFYNTTPGGNFDDGTPFEVTPDLIKWMASAIADTQQRIARVSSPVTSGDTAPKLLPFDINKEFVGNVVKDEKVLVNTVIGVKVIRLSQGAFFGDSLKLYYQDQLLDKGTDYLPYIVSPLTKQTSNKSGIYQYILLVGEFTGEVTIDYHAVGGEVQQDDVESVYELMVAIKGFLNEGLFITADTVTETPAFRALHARQEIMEEQLRNLSTGTPTYGDSNDTGSSSSVVRPVAATDSSLHWYTVATLYKVQGAPEVFLADQFKGRVFFPTANVALSFTVDVNLKQTKNPVSFKTDSLVFDPKYVMFGDVSVEAPVYPLMRLVWNEDGASFSGACLQIGIPLTNLSDKMVIENFSSTESCWLLDRTNPFVPGGTNNPGAPKDNGFTLPDGVSVWSETSNVSKLRTLVPEFNKGYLVYAGSGVSLSDLNTNSSTVAKFNVALPKYFPVRSVSSLIVTLSSSDSSVTYDVEISLPKFTNGSRLGRSSFADSVNEQVALSADLHQDQYGVITLSLNSALVSPAASSGSLSDVVRYVRAKV